MPKEDSRIVSAEGISADQRQQILLEASASDVVIAEVARRHGVNPDDLYRWRYAERQISVNADAGKESPGFVPVSVFPDAGSGSRMVRAHIEFSNEITLTLVGPVSAVTLNGVIELMEAP